MNRPVRTAQQDGGFTLTELLVVIVIVGILAAIAVPLYINQQARARVAAAQSDVSGLGREIQALLVNESPAGIRVGYTPLGPGYTADDVNKVQYTISTDGGATWDTLGRSSRSVFLLGEDRTTRNKLYNAGGSWNGVALLSHDRVAGTPPTATVTDTTWCLAVWSESKGSSLTPAADEIWRYSAQGGLENGHCGAY